MSAGFDYHASGRTRTALVVVGLIWAALLALWVFLDASVWVLALLAAFTLPALYDLAADPKAGCTLTAQQLKWRSGNRSVALDLSEIDHIRLDTRLDLSVRATAVLTTGRKVRMPFEATPPHQTFEDALTARGLRVKRFHFQFLQ